MLITATQVSFVIQSALSLILLAFIILSWWPGQRLDLFRQQMFALRDELFDFALDGHVSFDDPAYRLLRDLMNGLIRYAHNITPYRTAMSFLRWKSTSNQPTNGWTVSWERALKSVESRDTRDKLQAFHSRVSMLVVSRLVLSPGLLVTVLPFAVLGIIISAPWATLRDIYNGVSGRIPVALLEEEAANS